MKQSASPKVSREGRGKPTWIGIKPSTLSFLPFDDFGVHFRRQQLDDRRLACAGGSRQDKHAAVLGQFRIRPERLFEPVLDVGDLARMDRELFLLAPLDLVSMLPRGELGRKSSSPWTSARTGRPTAGRRVVPSPAPDPFVFLCLCGAERPSSGYWTRRLQDWKKPSTGCRRPRQLSKWGRKSL